MIEQKHFRQDLYFRIAVVKVEVPSLNDRPEDIIPIAQLSCLNSVINTTKHSPTFQKK